MYVYIYIYIGHEKRGHAQNHGDSSTSSSIVREVVVVRLNLIKQSFPVKTKYQIISNQYFIIIYLEHT